MSVIYTPGNEPEKIKEKVERYFAKIAAAYPDKIVMGLVKDHKKWGEQAKAIRESLGYEDNKSFFEAYGFKYESKPCTPVASLVDDASVIAELKKRYEGKEKPKSMEQLKSDNPDFAGNIKTMANRAKESFGMPLAKYFKQEGILYNPEAEGSALEVLKKRYADGPFTGTLQELKAQNTDISWWSIEKECAELDPPESLKDYLVSQGVIVEDAFELRREKREQEKAEKFTPEKSKPIVDLVVEELKKRYSNNFCLPKSTADLFAENKDIIDEDFKTHLKTAYPDERSNEFFGRHGLMRPNVADLSREMFENLKDRFKKTNEKFVITEEAVKDEFGISLDEFYYIIAPRDGNPYFEGYIELKSESEEIHNVLGFADLVFTKMQKENVYFKSMEDIMSAFPQMPYPELNYQIRHSGYATNLKDYFSEIGVFVTEKYYRIISFEEFAGQECYIDVKDTGFKNALKSILTHSGASVQTTAYSSIDYIITEDVCADDASKKHNRIVTECVNKTNAWGLRKLVPAYLLGEMHRTRLINIQVDYSDISLDSLQGKGCMFVEGYDTDEKAKIKDILIRNGAEIKRALSKNVDYYIVSNKVICDLNNTSASLLPAVDQNKKTGRPIIIDGDLILSKEDAFVRNLLSSLNEDDKLNYALSLYKKCVEKVENKLNDGYYNHPICSGMSYIRLPNNHATSNDINNADAFLEIVAGENVAWGNKQKVFEMYKSQYKGVIEEKHYYYDGAVGILAPIALSVACFVYGSPDCKVYIEWTRDKWEYRGDYSSSFRYAFTVSPSCPEGYIFKEPYEKYDM